MKYSVLFFICMITSAVALADTVQQGYSGDYVVDWANGSMNATASGYNDGSIMNEGRHWAAADNFTLAETDQQWKADSLSFVCGSDLGAVPTDFRVSLFADNDGLPTAYSNYLFRYEEASASLDKFTVTSTFAGGTKDRYIYDVVLDMSSFGLLLNGDTQYYLSVEGDVSNPQNVYNGYDTYYQRFYALRSNTGSSLYTSNLGEQWNVWQPLQGDMIWTINVTEVPEPATLLLLAFGVAMLRKTNINNP